MVCKKCLRETTLVDGSCPHCGSSAGLMEKPKTKKKKTTKKKKKTGGKK